MEFCPLSSTSLLCKAFVASTLGLVAVGASGHRSHFSDNSTYLHMILFIHIYIYFFFSYVYTHHICIYVDGYICMLCVCVYIYICTCICMYVCTYIPTYIYLRRVLHEVFVTVRAYDGLHQSRGFDGPWRCRVGSEGMPPKSRTLEPKSPQSAWVCLCVCVC